jgi:hypothetical protein
MYLEAKLETDRLCDIDCGKAKDEERNKYFL